MAGPAYIPFVGHGAASLAAPGAFTNARAYAFVFDADKAAMQSLADRLLNAAGRGQLRYEAFIGKSMATFMDIERCTSGNDVVGWVPGRECALWVPLLEYHGGSAMPHRIVLWAPYDFTNDTIGMLTARDVWGWPKVDGRIAIPGAASALPARFVCRTITFDPLAVATRGRLRPLISVTSPYALGAPGSDWPTGTAAVSAMVSEFLGGLGAPAQALGLSRSMPCVAMKQSRHSSNMSQAVYQAIVDSPLQVDAFHGGGLLAPANFSLSIATCASHDIVRDLCGVAPTPVATILPVRWAAWFRMDFSALRGDTLVAAP
jgi:hypothetical protein